MKDALREALKSPLFLAFPVAILGGLLSIVVIVVLGFRSMRMDEIRASQQRMERHLELLDRQNVKTVEDSAKLHEAVRAVKEQVQ